jgi:hypothetical protein
MFGAAPLILGQAVVSSANAQDWASSTQAWAEVATAAISLLAFAGLIITINLQRRQSAVEGNSRAKHDELVDRQLAQLLALQETAARRQADNVTVFWERKLTVPSLSGGPFLAARVENRTGRPIRDVRVGARSNPDERYAYTSMYQLCLSTGTPVDGPSTHDVVVYAMPDGFGYQFVSGLGTTANSRRIRWLSDFATMQGLLGRSTPSSTSRPSILPTGEIRCHRRSWKSRSPALSRTPSRCRRDSSDPVSGCEHPGRNLRYSPAL